MPEPTRRVIAHLDCDAFYVSVELLRRPELVGKPVVVAGSGPRAVVTTASYEARKFGVGSASPAAQARRLCPQAVFIPPDFQAYRAKSREVWTLVGERLPVVAQVGLDEGYADVTDAEKPLRVLRDLVTEVRDRTGITISVGVGPNRLIAKVSSDLEKPRGFVAMGREEACRRLAGASLRIIPGIGPKTAERLAAMGFTTIGALQKADADVLAQRFGTRHGRDLHRPRALPRLRRRRGRVRAREVALERDDVRPRHRRARRAGGRAHAARRRADRGPAAQAGARPHRRDQGPARRLDHGDAGAHAARARQRHRDGDRASRSSCCAPTRPRARCGCSGCGWRRSSATARTAGAGAPRALAAAHAARLTGREDRAVAGEAEALRRGRGQVVLAPADERAAVDDRHADLRGCRA